MRAKLNPNEYSATVFISSSCGTKSCNNDWLAVGFMLRMIDNRRFQYGDVPKPQYAEKVEHNHRKNRHRAEELNHSKKTQSVIAIDDDAAKNA